MILTSQRLIGNESYPETREALDVRQARWISRAGYIQTPVGLHVDVPAVFEVLDPVGLVLPGGNDLPTAAPGDRLSDLRMKFETRLIDEAIHRGLPILGVCKGFQTLAHHFGEDVRPCEGHVATHHRISAIPDLFISESHGAEFEVNSYHNFCMTRVRSNEILPAAVCISDGTIEAYQHVSLPVFGVMWHPEREEPLRAPDVSMLRNLFGAGVV